MGNILVYGIFNAQQVNKSGKNVIFLKEVSYVSEI